jgi:parallel beta-helix repeat protein
MATPTFTPTPEPVTVRLVPDGSGDYPSLEAAVDAVPTGTTITLEPGIYRLAEPLDIHQPLRLVGAGMNQTKIVSEAEGYVILFSGDGPFIVENITFRHEGEAMADVVVVEGGEVAFTRCLFTGAVVMGEEEADRAGLRLAESTSGLVQDCVAERNERVGILVEEEAQVTLEANACSDNGIGIGYGGDTSGVARQNRCTSNEIGIKVAGQAQPTLEGNVCSDNEAGILYRDNTDGVARQNQCAGNTMGILITDQARPTLESNVCSDNEGVGIEHGGTAGGVARQNQCAGNGIAGILVFEQAQPTLEENVCMDNEVAGIGYIDSAAGVARQNQCMGNDNGILIRQEAHPTLEQNVCTNNGVGISIRETADPDLIDNDCHDNVEANIRDVRTATPPVVEMMVEIPAGEFIMGNDGGNDDEKPAHTVTLDAFEIDMFEVTNADFALFVADTGYVTEAEKVGRPSWRDYAEGKDDHPVVSVTWNDAVAYCEWLGKRLPTEAEWEKAARGTDGRIYPWGNEFDGSQLNFCDTNCVVDSRKDRNADDGHAFTAPVGSYPAGASPYGVMDMSGNVWEWTADWYEAYPGSSFQSPYYGEQYRVLRGGGWFETAEYVHTTNRNATIDTAANDDIGFRCAR